MKSIAYKNSFPRQIAFCHIWPHLLEICVIKSICGSSFPLRIRFGGKWRTWCAKWSIQVTRTHNLPLPVPPKWLLINTEREKKQAGEICNTLSLSLLFSSFFKLHILSINFKVMFWMPMERLDFKIQLPFLVNHHRPI